MIGRRVVFLVVLANAFWVTLPSVGGADDPEVILNVLRERDKALFEAFTLSLDVRSSEPVLLFGDDRQGMVTKKCTLTRKANERGLTTLHQYESAPIFAPPGYRGYKPGDYDEQGHLIAWRCLARYALFSEKINNRLEVQQSNRVNSEGMVVRDPNWSAVYIYPLGDENYFFEFQRLLMALGRGFASQIERVKEARLLDNGLLEVAAAAGKLGVGTWRLTVDPAADYLIRSASLTSDNSTAPIFLFSSTGRVAAGALCVAERGRASIRITADLSLDEDVTVTSFTNRPSETHLETLRGKLTEPFPEEVRKVDMRAGTSQSVAPSTKP